MKMIFTLNPATGAVAFVEEDDHSEEGDTHTEGESHSESDEVLNPVIPNGYDIVWAGIFFCILWALMKFVLLPPILNGRNERNAKAQAARDAAGSAEANLAAIRAGHDETLASARAEAAAIVDAARGEVDADRQARVSAVEAEIAQAKAQASAEVEAARTAALAGVRGDVSNIAVGAASAVLGRSVDAGASQPIIDSFLD